MKRIFSLFACLLILLFWFGAFETINAQIKGQLLKSNGRPLPYTEIELVPIDSDITIQNPNLLSISGGNGSFSFPKVPHGEYTLSINFNEKPTELSPYEAFFYPNTKKREEAEVFVIDENTKSRFITFKLPPPLQQLKVTGKVVDSKGKPQPNVYVHLHDAILDDLFFSLNFQTDKAGNFSIKGFENQIYLVTAIQLARPPTPFERPEVIATATSDFFLLNAKTPILTLTLKETENNIRKKNKTIGKLILLPENLIR